jgi:hypothetical protein
VSLEYPTKKEKEGHKNELFFLCEPCVLIRVKSF